MLDVILETWSQGGIVLVPIFLAAFWGFVLVMRTWIRLGRNRGSVSESALIPRFEEIGRLLQAGEEAKARAAAAALPGVAGYGAGLLLDNRGLPVDSLRALLEEKLSFRQFQLERHIPLIQSLAAAAPLLGLLGTVHGLINTFRAMKEFGSGNAQILSRGISEALIAAQTGLLVAIILILFGYGLEGRIRWLKDQTEYGISLLLNFVASARRPASGTAPVVPPNRIIGPITDSPDTMKGRLS
jgi:biopolymer transport protein ExbB